MTPPRVAISPPSATDHAAVPAVQNTTVDALDISALFGTMRIMVSSSNTGDGRRRSVWARVCRVGVALLVTVAAWSAAPQTASAHASLVGSDPSYAAVLTEAPTQVQLLFDNPVEPGLVKVRLRDEAGTEIGKGELIGDRTTRAAVEMSLPAHGDGEWVISWVTFAFDGHVVSGTIPYTVDANATPLTPAPGGTNAQSQLTIDAGGSNAVVDIVDIQVRFFSYLTLAATIGAAVWLWLLNGLRRNPSAASEGVNSEGANSEGVNSEAVDSTEGPALDDGDRSTPKAEATPDALEVFRRTARKTLPVAALASAALLVVRGAVAFWRLVDGGFELTDVAPLLWSGQLTVFVVAAGCAAAAYSANNPVRSAALAAAAVALPATAGHASSYVAPGVGAALAGLHASAAMMWAGAVVMCAYVAADASFANDPHRWATIRPALHRLSGLLWASFAVLVVTGVRAAVVFADGMPEGRWGLTLAAKLLLVAVAALIGAGHFLAGRRGKALSMATLIAEATVLCLALTAAAVLATTIPA